MLLTRKPIEVCFRPLRAFIGFKLRPESSSCSVTYAWNRCSSKCFTSATAVKKNNFKPFVMKLPENAMMVTRFPVKQKRGDAASNCDCNSEEQDPWCISILFEYQRSPDSQPKVISMKRPPKDSFLNTLGRLKRKFVQRSMEAMSLDVSGDVSVDVEGASSSDLGTCSNEDIFLNESISSIRINGKRYRLVRDPPECTKLVLALDPRVGFPLMASYDLSKERKEPDSLRFCWYVGSSHSSKPLREESDLHEFLKNKMEGWELRHIGATFVPQEQDIGKYVCVILDLGSDTVMRCAISEKAVEGTNGTPMIFEERQREYSQKSCKNSLRIMSYNILADLYLNLNMAQEELFFPYCPKEYQKYAYRYPILLKEIPGYNADLIFLQEVDERLHLRFLPQHMKSHGYITCFKRKGLVVNEGLAICFREDRLRLKSTHDMWLTDLLNPELFPENADIVAFLEQDSCFKEHFVSRPAVLQLLVLTPLANEETIILAANTHLHFHPLQDDIKVLQALLCTRHIARITKDLRKQFPNKRIELLFGGDFNSTPKCAVYELLRDGTIPKDHECWKSSLTEGHQPLDTSLVSLSSGLGALRSLTAVPPYTNYTRHQRNGVNVGFAGCLDYIWGTSSVEVVKVVPMPSDDLVKKYIALPSKISASDHLPLICDIKLG